MGSQLRGYPRPSSTASPRDTRPLRSRLCPPSVATVLSFRSTDECCLNLTFSTKVRGDTSLYIWFFYQVILWNSPMCVCVCESVLVMCGHMWHMGVFMQKPQVNCESFLRPAVHLVLWDSVSPWPGSHWLGEAGWAVSPRGLPIPPPLDCWDSRCLPLPQDTQGLFNFSHVSQFGEKFFLF